jgi:hypothetical protein
MNFREWLSTNESQIHTEFAGSPDEMNTNFNAFARNMFISEAYRESSTIGETENGREEENYSDEDDEDDDHYQGGYSDEGGDYDEAYD